MPKLILFNNIGHTQSSTGVKQAGFERSLWFCKENDIVLASSPMSSGCLDYIGCSLGFDASTVTVVTPKNLNANLLTDQDLLAPDIIQQLQPLIAKFQSWEVMPCFYTSGVVELCERLAIKAPAGAGFASQGGLELLNRKIAFRRLASSISLPIAAGSIAYSAKSLAREIKIHLLKTGNVIVKKDYGYGGLGNIGITSEDVGPLSGVKETFLLDTDIDLTVKKITALFGESLSEGLVVESYYPSAHLLYFEYFIDELGHPKFLNSGSIRVSKPEESKQLLWFGLDIPPVDAPGFSFSSALTDSMRFAMLAAQVGYRGFINIDAIITPDNKVIFNESNGRWGGCTVMHTTAERLCGIAYGNKAVLSSRRKMSAPLFEESVNILKQKGLSFNSNKTEGVIILGSSERANNAVECLFIAPTLKRVREIERLTLSALHHE